MAELNLFDHINNLTSVKHQYSNDDLTSYPPYVINIAFSMSQTTVLVANEMNRRHNTSARMNKDFYQNILPQGKIYLKWKKSKKDDIVPIIQEYYRCNKEVAYQYLEILTEDDIKAIEQELYTGGKVK